MEEYIKFMAAKERKTAFKIFLFCALCFFVFSAVAYLNTRFNGFADVKPAAHFFALIKALWERISENLYNYPQRFLH